MKKGLWPLLSIAITNEILYHGKKFDDHDFRKKSSKIVTAES